MEARAPRAFATRDELSRFLSQQLWIAAGGEKERMYQEALDRLVEELDGGFGLVGQRPLPVGVVTWSPTGA